jgi:hypothetical protein
MLITKGFEFVEHGMPCLIVIPSCSTWLPLESKLFQLRLLPGHQGTQIYFGAMILLALCLYPSSQPPKFTGSLLQHIACSKPFSVFFLLQLFKHAPPVVLDDSRAGFLPDKASCSVVSGVSLSKYSFVISLLHHCHHFEG